MKPIRDAYVDILQPGVSLAAAKGGLTRGLSLADEVDCEGSGTPLPGTAKGGACAFALPEPPPTGDFQPLSKRWRSKSTVDTLPQSGLDYAAVNSLVGSRVVKLFGTKLYGG